MRLGGARPAPVTLSTIKYKVVVHPNAPAERADTCTLPLCLLYPYVYSMSLPQEKPTSKGTNREPSLDFSVSDCEALLTMLDDDRCHTASPVPRIYGAPRPPQILAHLTPFLALFLWGRDAIGALTVSQTFVGLQRIYKGTYKVIPSIVVTSNWTYLFVHGGSSKKKHI